MKVSSYIHTLIGICALAYAGACSALSAEPVNSFYAKDSALDIFGTEVVENPNVTFQHSPARVLKKLDVIKDDEVEPQAQQPADESHTSEPAEKAEHKAGQDLRSAEDILKAYGNPEENMPVLAQENAPKPFKAMMAAFQVGDEKLAYQYARQWVRYMDDLKARTQQVVRAAGSARQAEEAVSGDSDEAQKIKALIANDNAPDGKLQLDGRARAILAQAQQDENAAAMSGRGVANEPNPEMKARAEIRAALKGRIPVDSEGKVDVYLFVDPSDPATLEFSGYANALAAVAKRHPGTNIVLFTTRMLDKSQLSLLGQRLKVNIPLLNGDSFAREMKITSAPAVVLIAPNSGGYVKESAEKPVFYFDEVIRIMRGEKL